MRGRENSTNNQHSYDHVDVGKKRSVIIKRIIVLVKVCVFFLSDSLSVTNRSLETTHYIRVILTECWLITSQFITCCLQKLTLNHMSEGDRLREREREREFFFISHDQELSMNNHLRNNYHLSLPDVIYLMCDMYQWNIF